MSEPYEGLIKRYREWLPLEDNTTVVSLNEGATPLLACTISRRASAEISNSTLIRRHNPTGSFKDRGMTVAVSQAVTKGRKRSSAPRLATPLHRLPAYAARLDSSLCGDSGRQDRAG